MGSEHEHEQEQEKSYRQNLPLLKPYIRSKHSHRHRKPSMATTPIHSLASVPFSWEDKPGKPKHKTTVAVHFDSCLQLPPTRLFATTSNAIRTKPKKPRKLDRGSYYVYPEYNTVRITAKRTNFWETVLEGLKRLVPWKRDVMGS